MSAVMKVRWLISSSSGDWPSLRFVPSSSDICFSLISKLHSIFSMSHVARSWVMPTGPLYQRAKAPEKRTIGSGGFLLPCLLPPLAGEPGFLDLGHQHQVLVHPEQF